MAIDRTYYCEGPDCDVPRDEPVKDEDRMPARATTASAPSHLPIGFIETRQRENGEDYLHHFCSWGCLMKYAAQQPEPIIISWDDIAGEGSA